MRGKIITFPPHCIEIIIVSWFRVQFKTFQRRSRVFLSKLHQKSQNLNQNDMSCFGVTKYFFLATASPYFNKILFLLADQIQEIFSYVYYIVAFNKTT